MNGAGVYLDASAFVKTIAEEPESEALMSFLRSRPHRVSSALLRAEAMRAARHLGPDAMGRTNAALERVELVAVSDDLLSDAGLIDPLTVRTLDAVHLATASALRDRVDVLVTYDRRMLAGAEGLGLQIASPA